MYNIHHKQHAHNTLKGYDKMKALSVTPFWAAQFMENGKYIECRSWKTDHRGDLLICSSDKKESLFINGRAVLIGHLIDCVPFTPEHLAGACMDKMPSDGRQYYAWIFEPDFDAIIPFKIKGQLHLLDVPDDLIKPFYFVDSEDDAEIDADIEKFKEYIWLPMKYRYDKFLKANPDLLQMEWDYEWIADVFADYEIDTDIWECIPPGFDVDKLHTLMQAADE